MEDKVISIIKDLREREWELNKKKRFCRNHNFDLEAVKFGFAEEEVRKICSKLQVEFNVVVSTAN